MNLKSTAEPKCSQYAELALDALAPSANIKNTPLQAWPNVI
jgi:hypothetical protein